MDELTPYWRATFYTPNDYITNSYFEVVEYFDKLPATMQLGLDNLEVKEPKPIKHIPLLTKLINGDLDGSDSTHRKACVFDVKFKTKHTILKITDFQTPIP